MVGVLLTGTLGAAPGQSDRADTQAREKFRIAQKAFNLGNFEQALDYYSQAYSLKAHPGFLFNIAQCYRMLREYERAAFFYKRYLALATPGRAETTLVTGLIQEVETKQAQLEQEARDQAEAAEFRERELARSQMAKAEADAAEKRRLELIAKEQAEREAAQRATQIAEAARAEASKPPPSLWSTLSHKWWFWAGAGVLAAGVGVTVYIATEPRARPTTQPAINGR
jgi:tetratricopeptide (TPR) repeat protein